MDVGDAIEAQSNMKFPDEVPKVNIGKLTDKERVRRMRFLANKCNEDVDLNKLCGRTITASMSALFTDVANRLEELTLTSTEGREIQVTKAMIEAGRAKLYEFDITHPTSNEMAEAVMAVYVSISEALICSLRK